jgi:hypothetical protein
MQRIMESFGELRDANLDIDESTNKSLGTRYVKYLSVESANFRYIDIEDARKVVKWLNGYMQGNEKRIHVGLGGPDFTNASTGIILKHINEQHCLSRSERFFMSIKTNAP